MPNTTEEAVAEDVAEDTTVRDKTSPSRLKLGRRKQGRGAVRRLQFPGMRLTLSLFDLFHHNESAKPSAGRATSAATTTPLAEMDDSVPTMGLWSSAMMLLALGFTRNRLPRSQRAAGKAKRAAPRVDA
jgi:hypothetical protein